MNRMAVVTHFLYGLYLPSLVPLSCSPDKFQSRGAPSSCFYTKATGPFLEYVLLLIVPFSEIIINNKMLKIIMALGTLKHELPFV